MFKKKELNRNCLYLILITVLGLFIYDIITNYNDYIRIKNINSLMIKNQKPQLMYLEREFMNVDKRNNTKATDLLMKKVKLTLVPPTSTYFHEPAALVMMKAIQIIEYKNFPYQNLADIVSYLSIVLGRSFF